MISERDTRLPLEYKINLKFRDYVAFLTKDDILFTTRGFYHTPDEIVAVPCYYADPSGDRRSKLLSKTFRRDVDEFGNIWLPKVRPDYIKTTKIGKKILVPISDIVQIFDPFDIPNETKQEIFKTKYRPIIASLIEIGVKEKDIGFYGSYLIGLQNQRSDIDIVIRGIDNMNKVRDNMDGLRDKLCAVGHLCSIRKEATLERYSGIYNPKRNDFETMVSRRWSTIRMGNDIMLKLMFTYKSEEVPNGLLPEELGEEKCLEGKVIDDTAVCFMPRHFIIENKDKKFNVLTYFYHFYYSVQKGDSVRIFGTISKDEKTIVLHDHNLHGIKFK